jgi:molybdenum cofactor guanylyltransferase
MKILGAIIAGGESKRMGEEKALLALDGVSILERIASRLRIQVDELVLNANGDISRFANSRIQIVPDLLTAIATPLAGLHAVLHHGAENNFDAVVTVPSDSPFIPLDLVSRLLEAGEEKGAAIARSHDQEHYLTGIWTTALSRPLEKLILQENLRRMQDFVTKVEAESVLWSDQPHDPFFNINTKGDFEIAERIARGEA